MRRRLSGLLRAGLLAAGLLLAACASSASASASVSAQTVPAHRPTALVYSGPAAGCSGCASAVAALLRRAPEHFTVRYVRTVTAAALRGATLYAQPGGNQSVAHAMRLLGPQATRAIRAYVAGGGHYVGFCLGAYLAGSDPGMGLLAPGDTGEYDRTRGASVTTTRDAVIPVRWGHATRWMYVQDPPYIRPGRDARVLSRFSNGLVNASVQPFGRGSVGVVGAHPEADRSWYSARLWHADRDGLDYRQGLQLIAATLAVR